MVIKMKKILSLILAIALIAAIIIPTLAADNKGTTIRLGTTQGKITVRNASSKEQSARKDMRLYNGYTVQTASASSAYLTLDDTKAAKLDANSKTELKKSGKQLELKLLFGKLYFGVTKPLKSDESLSVCTSTMVTGVRGSYGWVGENEMGLLHGHVTVTCRNPYTGEVRVTEVTSGQVVYFDPHADGTGAEPKLIEIDFIKRLMTNEDVPLTVIDELRKDTALQELLNSDVENLDVPTLLGLEAEKRAAEETELAAKEAEIAAAMAEQDAGIKGADQVFTPPSEGASTSKYTLTLPESALNYSVNVVSGGTAIDTKHYSVVAGQTITLEFICDGYSFLFGPDTKLENVAGTFTRGAAGEEYSKTTAVITMNSDLNLEDSRLYPVYTVSSSEYDLNMCDEVPMAINGPITIQSNGVYFPTSGGRVLITDNGEVSLEMGLEANTNTKIVNEGTIEINNSGGLTLKSGSELDNRNDLYVYSIFSSNLEINDGAVMNNSGSLTVEGSVKVDGELNNQSEVTVSGNLNVGVTGVLRSEASGQEGVHLINPASVECSGSIDIISGKFDISVPVTCNLGSSIVVESAGNMVIEAGEVSGSSDMVIRGTLSVSCSTTTGLNLSGGSLSVSGRLETSIAYGVIVNYVVPIEISGELMVGSGTSFETGLTGEATFTITETGSVVNYGIFFPRPAAMAVNRGIIENHATLQIGCDFDSYYGIIQSSGSGTTVIYDMNTVYYNEAENGELNYTGGGSVVNSPAP